MVHSCLPSLRIGYALEGRPMSSPELESELRTRLLHSTLAVSFYMAISIGCIFLNRLVLSDKTEHAGALFVSWFQFVVALVLILFISSFCQKVPVLNLFPPIHIELGILFKVLPVSFTYLLMIGLNNKCLEYVSVSGYQIVRSLSILFNIVLTYMILGETISLRASLACTGVVVGFFFGVEGELGLSVRGAIYGVLSSIFAALYAIVVKRVIGLLNGNEYLLIEYNTPIAILALTPGVWASGEFHVLFEKRSVHFWMMQTLAGVVGFVINIAIFLNIKYTTALTHNLTGTVKACLQTMLAFVVFKDSEVMTPMKFLGIVLVIGFSTYYAFVRRAEMRQKIIDEHDAKIVDPRPVEQDLRSDSFPEAEESENEAI
jgi:GDP-fucose transporter C1